MLKFRTELIPAPLLFSLNYNTPTLGLGSCFVENIGQLLIDYKFPVSINPLGIVYNPVSLARQFKFIADPTSLQHEGLVFHNGLWHSLDFHGNLSHPDQKKMIDNIDRTAQKTHQFLVKANFLIFTLGTAFAYVYNKTGEIVANCHKIPQSSFRKQLLSVTQIAEELNAAIACMRNTNPNLKIIATVSPIRHIKDGIVENQRSKATLLLAIHELADQLPDLYYFPSYEIMMDDLRDYRFYQEDLVHPTGQGIQYIWHRFRQACIEPEAIPIMDKVKKILKAIAHRPSFPQSENHQAFVEHQLKVIEQMEGSYPDLDWTSEKEMLRVYMKAPSES